VPVQSGDIRQVTTNLRSTNQLYRKDGSFIKEKGDPTKVVERSLGEQLNAETFRNFVALASRNRRGLTNLPCTSNDRTWLLRLRFQEFISMVLPLIGRIAEKLVLHV